MATGGWRGFPSVGASGRNQSVKMLREKEKKYYERMRKEEGKRNN
jgi:hypothetical protein